MPGGIASCGFRQVAQRVGVAVQDDARQEVVLPPQDRVLAVRPFWETVAQEERVKLLSLSLEELRARAEELTQRALKEQGALSGCAGSEAHLSSGGSRSWSASMKLAVTKLGRVWH